MSLQAIRLNTLETRSNLDSVLAVYTRNYFIKGVGYYVCTLSRVGL